MPEISEQDIKNYFHEMLYTKKRGTSWLGIQVDKNPLDLLNMQEIIVETKPDVIIECGTQRGGSALYMASICKLIGRGRVITIDIQRVEPAPKHELITYLTGDTKDPKVIEAVSGLIKPGDRVMVDLDSDHSFNHVLKEMEIYSRFVTLGCYMIVEDGNLNGHPVWPGFGRGPYEAIEEFLNMRKDFENDPNREKKYLVTYFTNGYLRRIR